MRKATVIGRLADNAMTKSGTDGKTFITFRLGCDSGFGQNKNTLWIDCTYPRAGIADYLLKGGLIYCEGEFDMRSYTGKDGQQHSVLTMRVRDIELLSRNHALPDERPTPPSSGAIGGNSLPF